VPLSTESYGCLALPAVKFSDALADAATLSAGSDATKAAFILCGMCERGVALVRGNDVVYRKVLCLYALGDGTAAHARAFVPTADVD
jgi:hypothetical protein